MSKANKIHASFYKIENAQRYTLVGLSTDDFLVIATNDNLISQLYNTLSTKYSIKNLGNPTLYLGWKIAQEKDGAVHISQPSYIDTALEHARMTEANGKDTRHASGVKYHPAAFDDKTVPHLTGTFQKIVGELRYITDCTLPDINFYVNKISAAMHNPTRRHWLILKNTLRHLKVTKEHGIIYKPKNGREQLATVFLKIDKGTKHPLHTYSDADFAGDDNDRKFTSSAVHLYQGAPIAWSSGKQSPQALSTCAAEYIAAKTALQTTQWLRRIMQEAQLLPNTPTPVLVDNKATIAVAKNMATTRKRKFIDLRYHFLREHIKNATITVHHVPSHSMLPDLLTKPMGRQMFQPLKAALRIGPRPKTGQDDIQAPLRNAPEQGACQDAQKR